MKEKVHEVIQEIRPNLQADGGDIELVDVTEDGIVKVKLQGACRGCPGAAMTLKMGVERILRSRIPEIKGVESV
ncbi:MAG: NifU family protein [Fibrobacter sp.]|nr:NifU family protein [Fibrobacter sp.]